MPSLLSWSVLLVPCIILPPCIPKLKLSSLANSASIWDSSNFLAKSPCLDESSFLLLLLPPPILFPPYFLLVAVKLLSNTFEMSCSKVSLTSWIPDCWKFNVISYEFCSALFTVFAGINSFNTLLLDCKSSSLLQDSIEAVLKTGNLILNTLPSLVNLSSILPQFLNV